MSDDGRRGGLDEEERGPGAVYHMYEVMTNLIDKLKLLNYEEHFLRKYNIKSISRHYFALSTNPGEQFYLFTTLCSWLINVGGRTFDTPQEYDDPNATISNILDELRRFGISTDFPPSKLKTGSGEFVCYVLDKLATTALHSTQFSWKRPLYPEEEQQEDEETIGDEDQAELKLDKIDNDEAFEVGADSDDDGVGPFLDLEASSQKSGKDAKKQSEIMQSKTNADEWKLEVERVTPSLKVTIRSDNKDWRSHVDQMHLHQKGIEHSLSDVRSQLDRLHDEIRRTLEKIGSREKYINNQLEHHLQEYRNAQDQLAQSREKYKQGSGGVTKHSRTLAELTEELEKVKLEMEEKGNSMTDGAPLVKIKQTLNRLKNESVQMDIRIGVIEHVLMQARLRDKTTMHNDMNKRQSLHDRIGDDDTDQNFFPHV